MDGNVGDQSLIPLFFAFLWSTGFIGAKFGLADVSPLFFLFLRMIAVLPIFIVLCIFCSHGSMSGKDRLRQLIVGIFVHGFFLGGAFSAIGGGVSAGVVSFITSLNPLLVLPLCQSSNQSSFLELSGNGYFNPVSTI